MKRSVSFNVDSPRRYEDPPSQDIGGGEVASNVDDTSIDPDLNHDGDVSSDGDGSSTYASGASSHSTADSHGNIKFHNGLRCLRKVPFEVQVIVVLMVPVLFLISFSAKNLAIAVAELRYVETKHGLMNHMTQFEHHVMTERARLGPFYAAHRASNASNATQLQADAWASFTEAVASTDEEWVVLQHEISPFATEDSTMAGVRNRLVEAMSFVKLNRENIRLRRIDSVAARNNYTAIVSESQGILRAMTRHDDIGHSLHSVLVVAEARRFVNYIGASQAVGNELISNPASWAADPSNTATVHALRAELHHDIASADEARRETLEVAKGYSERTLSAFFSSNETVRALQLVHLVDAHGLGANVTAAEWFDAMQNEMRKADDVLLDLADTHLGDEAKAFILTESLQMAFGTLFSLLCSAFIVFWQVRIAANIRRQQEHTRRVNTVVSSFVPKTFLRTMGCRSIMQISTGQQVNVATTMLFSDIRNFTNLSERMNNDELFDWLQKYFALMTRVCDRHNGTIDKFIGDAIFAFFNAASSSIKCAIDMQSVVVFLNSSLAPENLVQLGIGIHQGVVAFGVFGDEHRRTCTMVSSEVNLASRLEGLTKQYGVRIICSESVMDHINPDFFPLDVVNPVDLVDDSSSSRRPSAVEKRAQVMADGGATGRHELGCRFLGCAVVKGSARVVRIHEIFQGDDVQVRKYKAKSKPLFEEAVRLQEQDVLERGGGSFTVEKEAEYNPLRNRGEGSDDDDRDHDDIHDPNYVVEVRKTSNSLSLVDESPLVPTARPFPSVTVMCPTPTKDGRGSHSKGIETEMHSLTSLNMSVDDHVKHVHEPSPKHTRPKAEYSLTSHPGSATSHNSMSFNFPSISHCSVTKSRVNQLLDQCDALANECGVEDPVVELKRKACRRGTLDVFSHK